MRPKKKISQTLLAKELGVSQALVSLALNGRSAGINPDTYQRIWDRAISQGYLPKGMRVDSTPEASRLGQIGYILRAPLRLYIPSTYFGHVQHGLHQELERLGQRLVYLGAEDELSPAKLGQCFHPSNRLGGVVVLGEVARPFLGELCRHTRRVVAVSARYHGLCHSVLGNEPGALTELVRHLFNLGHQRFGWLGGNAGLGRHNARLAAFTAALQPLGLALDPRYTVIVNQADRAEGAEAIHTLLRHAKRKDFPTAFVTYNSQMAYGAALTLQRAGWRVPGDISLASADVSRLSVEGALRITGAGTSPDKLGEAAARLVAGEGTPAEGFSDLVLPAPLVVGNSTGPAR
ncbi:Maltose regulon regulatory protein MalI [Lacunisphaera limnophila]|uniref:Maltose regulon regulatory protein MalI n=1 Tax=Lacunisphaera limnophila TaxID=1838286 RepID=A0A1D8ATI1_9BACT|nr:LacI family DNA-binding transcriptional regulator [Lacunisphaera limnophila]AOS44208.1 Maltose regulon regulatory protein MalI [Lacunisphaera limnophila]